MLENGFQPPVSFHHLLFSQGRKSGKCMVVIRYNTCRIAMETSSALLLLLLLPIIRFFFTMCVYVYTSVVARGVLVEVFSRTGTILERELVQIARGRDEERQRKADRGPCARGTGRARARAAGYTLPDVDVSREPRTPPR